MFNNSIARNITYVAQLSYRRFLYINHVDQLVSIIMDNQTVELLKIVHYGFQ